MVVREASLTGRGRGQYYGDPVVKHRRDGPVCQSALNSFQQSGKFCTLFSTRASSVQIWDATGSHKLCRTSPLSFGLFSISPLCVTNIRDAKTALDPVERGLDVVFDPDGRRVGAHHTIFHADEGQIPGMEAGSFELVCVPMVTSTVRAKCRCIDWGTGCSDRGYLDRFAPPSVVQPNRAVFSK
jgi:hypothetical protein